MRKILTKLMHTPRPEILNVTIERRPELAHKMWQSGKSYAEIGEMLQVSSIRARRMIHHYAWVMRQPELRDNRMG